MPSTAPHSCGTVATTILLPISRASLRQQSGRMVRALGRLRRPDHDARVARPDRRADDALGDAGDPRASPTAAPRPPIVLGKYNRRRGQVHSRRRRRRRDGRAPERGRG